MTAARAACVAFLLLSVAHGAHGRTLESYLATLDSSTPAINTASGPASLSGTIPRDIDRFKLLRSFKLIGDTTSQNVSGTIPHHFCNLTNLEALSVYKTRISGASVGRRGGPKAPPVSFESTPSPVPVPCSLWRFRTSSAGPAGPDTWEYPDFA